MHAMDTPTFKDHFSGHAGDYTRYRPSYPAGLFAFLAKIAPATDRVWDCATGNGQAANGLAAHFTRVEATDASAEQIANARPHSRVHYAVAPAHASGLPDASCDLVTVAQALHWFDLDGFYAEVRRVARPGGLIAVWSYALCVIAPAVDAVTRDLYELTGPYWPPERRHVETGYTRLDFPFPEQPTPELAMVLDWTLTDYLGYLGTWSGVKRYQKACGEDPIARVETAMRAGWGDPEQRRKVSWPLTLRVGRIT